ncbi:tetratricopeptide repeat protein [Aestuariivirga litoralis]|uniref:tetratricopeptide repeat protein n=1 Tax=Aestuariivirga litoralis TaxID=2650924 RepID=UPI0018C4FD03|nr:tetratricopeptide repeat protein [Aestuariivirga litoralis]
MSDNNDAIFREVDEEVRQEEYKKLWTRHGRLITAAALLFIAAIAGWQGWKYYEKKQAEDASAIYYDALRKATDGKPDDALADLSVIRHAGFAQLAKLEQAAILGKKGDADKAVAAYDAFATDASNDPALVDLARIRAGYLLVDSQSPDQLLTRLGRYDKDDALWHNQAREIFGLSAYRVKDYAMADRYFNAISVDAKASQGLKQRAELMLQLLAPNLPAK